MIVNGQIAWESQSFSLHPTNWSDSTYQEIEKLVNQLPKEKTDFIFYGAGCNREENKEKAKKFFQPLGFRSIQVEGDLLAAAKASLSNSPGCCAILGSGSVLIEYDGQRVVRFSGGLGSNSGDEGSGYFFGKLILQAFQEGKLSPSVKDCLQKRGLDRPIEQSSKADVLCLSELLYPYKKELKEIHQANIDRFFDLYLSNDVESKTLHFVGSYAYFYQDIVKSRLENRGWSIGKVIRFPLENLIKTYLSVSE